MHVKEKKKSLNWYLGGNGWDKRIENKAFKTQKKAQNPETLLFTPLVTADTLS